MLDYLCQGLLTVLQLTRMALVLTAISNSLCTLLLAIRREAGEDADLLSWLDWRQMVAIAMISTGLYGFGMSLNDIIDRRRDRQIASHRPLPSGRIGLIWAHVICGMLALLALGGGLLYWQLDARLPSPGWRSLVLLAWTGLLITFYDFAGKYLVAIGLVTLGLIRFFHALIPAPQMPLLWHPLTLFTHVAILSMVAYVWEEKRPALTRLHWITVLGLVGLVDVAAIAVVGIKAWEDPQDNILWMKIGLLLPVGLGGAFALLAWWIRRHSETSRQAGQTLMLIGLLWLIIYDSAFAAVYVGWLYGAGMLMLLPASYLMVVLMRWWSRLMLLSQKPEFKRARTESDAGPPPTPAGR